MEAICFERKSDVGGEIAGPRCGFSQPKSDACERKRQSDARRGSKRKSTVERTCGRLPGGAGAHVDRRAVAMADAHLAFAAGAHGCRGRRIGGYGRCANRSDKRQKEDRDVPPRPRGSVERSEPPVFSELGGMVHGETAHGHGHRTRESVRQVFTGTQFDQRSGGGRWKEFDDAGAAMRMDDSATSATGEWFEVPITRNRNAAAISKMQEPPRCSLRNRFSLQSATARSCVRMTAGNRPFSRASADSTASCCPMCSRKGSGPRSAISESGWRSHGSSAAAG